MEQIDFLERDKQAGDHASSIVLHKHHSRAEGYDRKKQGVIVIASDV